APIKRGAAIPSVVVF
nr:EP3=low Mr zona pellucida binding protein {N-terminal} [swine, pH3 extract of cauda epididymal spermatozoa, Peptide Partial, 15 aa] [Sus scrofa]